MNPRLRQHVYSLRLRLAMLNLLVFGVILTVISAVALGVREQDLREAFDERLRASAEQMLQTIRVTVSPDLERETPRSRSPRLIPFRFPGHYFQLCLSDGRIVERSRNLGDVKLPLSDQAISCRHTGEPVLETIHDDDIRSPLERPKKLRLLTVYDDEPDGEPFFLQVAASLEPVEESIAGLRRLYYVLIPIGLAVVGVASWLMARRALRPIGRIAREARELTAARLDRRIDVPGGRDESAELVVTINDLLARLEAAFNAQERFVADASHELKTPITVLLGQAQVLTQQARTAEEYDRFVASVQDEMRHMARLVDSLLTLARADAGLPLTAAAPVSVNETVMDAVARCQVRAQQQEVALVPVLAMPPADEPHPQVRGEATLLRAMVENLIRNAIRHSPPGQTVEVETQLHAAVVDICVRDHGPGIPPEHLEHVFDRFYSFAHGRHAAPGTGLGLAIAKGVTTLHHGTIRALNRPEGGCELTVSLPLSTENDSPD
jgi:two-component system OmpR family sensor kinase